MKQITCPHCADTYPDFDVAHVCSKGPYALKLKPNMNEKLKEIAIKAQVEHCVSHVRLQEFAELIVKECADVAWMNTPETEELEYSHLISDKIKQHFGIKE